VRALRAFTDGLHANPESRELSDRTRDLRKRLRQAPQQAGRAGGGGARGAAAAAGFNMGAPDAWARGLPVDQRHEWLVDCYRMRVDDECAWRGEQRGLCGLGGKDEVVTDFLVSRRRRLAGAGLGGAARHSVGSSGGPWPLTSHPGPGM
jgi:hypothetical protein